MAVFMLQRQMCIVGTETIQHASLNYSPSDLYRKCLPTSPSERDSTAYTAPHQTSIMAILKNTAYNDHDYIYEEHQCENQFQHTVMNTFSGKGGERTLCQFESSKVITFISLLVRLITN